MERTLITLLVGPASSPRASYLTNSVHVSIWLRAHHGMVKSLAKHRVDDIYCILHIHCICHFIIEGTDTGQAHCDTGKSVLTAASFCPLLIMKKTSRRICSIILLANEAVLTRLKISSSSFLSFRWA